MKSFTESSMEGSLEAMTTPLLTIAEASDKTGRSHSTIRRLIKTITESADHVDRAGIEPTPKAVEAFKKKGENFTWKIREDVLIKHLPSAPTAEKKSGLHSGSEMTGDILQILKHELDLKNQQIEKQWDVIQSLNDRLREGNILMGSLQQRLALPHPESPAPINVDTPPTEASTILQKASKKKVAEVKQKLSKKTPVEASTDTPKKRMLSWLFR